MGETELVNPYEAPRVVNSSPRRIGLATVGLSLSGAGLVGMQGLAFADKVVSEERVFPVVILLMILLAAGFVASVASFWTDSPSRLRGWALVVSSIGLLFIPELAFPLLLQMRRLS